MSWFPIWPNTYQLLIVLIEHFVQWDKTLYPNTLKNSSHFWRIDQLGWLNDCYIATLCVCTVDIEVLILMFYVLPASRKVGSKLWNLEEGTITLKYAVTKILIVSNTNKKPVSYIWMVFMDKLHNGEFLFMFNIFFKILSTNPVIIFKLKIH